MAAAACTDGSAFETSPALPDDTTATTDDGAPSVTTEPASGSSASSLAAVAPGAIETGEQLCAVLDQAALVAAVDGADPATSSFGQEAGPFPVCVLTMRGVDGDDRGQIVMTSIADDFDSLLASAPPSTENPRVAGLGDRAVLSRSGPSVFVDAGGLLWLVAVRQAPDVEARQLEAVARLFIAGLGGRSVVYEPLVPPPLDPGPDVGPVDPGADFCAVYDEANAQATPGSPGSEDAQARLAESAAAVIALTPPPELADDWPPYREGLLRLFSALVEPGTTQWDATARLEAWEGFDDFRRAVTAVEDHAADHCPS
ncbi:MAG: hypothetical protein AAGK32_01190 [Actinomycetota bacterium]